MAVFTQTDIPKMKEGDLEGSLKALYKYMQTLNEQLAYLFANLGGDNFNVSDMNNYFANLGATNIITQTIVSNSVVTKSLYAERGDIAQLTVDWLSTSTKVANYLNGDTSDDNYIEVHEQGIELKTASVVMNGSTPVTEHLKDRYGKYLYWSKDISYAEIRDGNPWVNGKQVYMDTMETEYPVQVYSYNVTTKMLIDFDTVNGEKVPKITMGDVEVSDRDVTVNGKKFTDVASGLETLTSSVNSLSSNVGTLSSKLNALQTNVTRIDEDLTGIAQSISNAESSIQTINTTLESINASITALDQRVTALESAASTTE